MKTALIMTVPFFLGWALDFIIGDPDWMPHPERLIKRFVRHLEPVTRGAFPRNPRGERTAGTWLAVLVPMVSMLVAALLLAISWLISPVIWMALESLLCYQLISARRLRDDSMKVCRLLENKEEHGDLSRARLALSRFVTRDTDKLNRQEIVRASIESVAENTSCKVVAPLFFIALGGSAIGVFYKSIHTLAEIVCYPGDKYSNFGIASARLKEVFTFVPSFIAARLMLLSTLILGMDYKNAARLLKSWRADDIASPYSQTGPVCAGALGITIGGGAFYSGVFYIGPAAGDSARPVDPLDIRLANKLMLLTSFFSLILFGSIKILILYILI